MKKMINLNSDSQIVEAVHTHKYNENTKNKLKIIKIVFSFLIVFLMTFAFNKNEVFAYTYTTYVNDSGGSIIRLSSSDCWCRVDIQPAFSTSNVRVDIYSDSGTYLNRYYTDVSKDKVEFSGGVRYYINGMALNNLGGVNHAWIFKFYVNDGYVGENKVAWCTSHTGGTATCQKLKVCSRCGLSYGTYAGHTPSGWKTNSSQHWKECTLCGTITTAKANHADTNANGYCNTCNYKMYTIISVPTAKTGLVYNGSSQTGVATGTGYTITGNTGTNAGSYTATASLQSGYRWTGAATGNKSISWSIGKANSSNPTLTAFSGYYNGSPQAVSVGSYSGGTLQYSSDNSTWGTSPITRTDVGTTMVYVRVQGDSNHNDTMSISSTINIKYPKLTLDENEGTATQLVVYPKYGTTNVYTEETGSTAGIISASKTGYTFNGWYTQSSGGTRVLDASGNGTGTAVEGYMNEDKQWAMLEDKTLYAQWTANIYTCTFDANGGTTPIPETLERIYEQKIADTISGFPTTTRKGYEFAGWYTAAEGGVKLSEVSIMPDMDVTYYAQWTPNAYIIGTDDYPTLKAAIDSVAEGGSATIVVTQDVVDPSEAIVPSNKTITIETNGNTITKTVYTIVNDGNLSIIGGGRIITGGSYTVTLNANDGTGGTESVIAIWKTEMPSATIPTRSGYTFQGYYDDITGGTQYYTETGESARLWDKEENSTLYARWTENT